MHLLDRLAALAIILQFIAVCALLVFFFKSSASQDAQLKAIEARVYTPNPVSAEVTATPSATEAPVVTAFPKGALRVLPTAIVLPRK